jgi:nucleoside-diphosphate kinase
MTKERTLIFLKPDVLEKRLIGKVIEEIEEKTDLKFLGIKMMKLSRRQAEKFYEVHRGKGFYNDLVTYITRGPVVALLLEGEKAIERMRTLMGATDPVKAEKGTLRGKFGESLDANVCHGSDGTESARTEIPFYFSEAEIVSCNE